MSAPGMLPSLLMSQAAPSQPPPTYTRLDPAPHQRHAATTAKTGFQYDSEWVDGDCEVVTADHVRFVLPSFYLLAARWVREVSSYPE